MVICKHEKDNLITFTLVLVSLAVIFSYGMDNVSATSYTDIYVSPTGDDINDGGDPLHPAQTIKHALGVTKNNGSTIHLADGIYSGTDNTNITISKSMTIKGQSQTSTIINGTDTNWIFYIPSGINVTIINLKLTNGAGNNAGGAIYNNGGTLTVTNSTFNSNKANWGGAIYSTTNLAITSSTFTDNHANTDNGGAIFSEGNLTVTSSTFTGNTAYNGYGGAIDSISNLTVTCSTFTNNYASIGGAIYSDGNTLNITSSTFTNNHASGIYSYGGAIYNSGGTQSSPSTISNSTFTGNTAPYGGAISNIGTLNVYFNRIVGNTASQGSDIYNDGGIVNAPFNWWGDNNGPTGKIEGLSVSKWLILTMITSISAQINSDSKVTADLRYDNTGILHTEGYIPNGIPVSFTTSLGTISSPSYISNGIAQSTLKSNLLGSAGVSAKLDNQTIQTSVKIVDTIPPKVTSTYPKKGAKGISRTSTIKIKFSEKIKKSINWSKIYIKNKYGKVKITKKWISGNYLYIKTKKRISKKYYTVYIPVSAIKDYTGNNLIKHYTFKFKT